MSNVYEVENRAGCAGTARGGVAPMSDAAHDAADIKARTGSSSAGMLGMLLTCYSGNKTAAKARHDVDAKLKSQGDALLDTVILQVNGKHKASVHDPRRVVQGTVTATVTWGLFGLLAGGLDSLAIWAIIGAICGGLWAYYTEHLLKKDEMARIGRRMPANSSALATFTETHDPRNLPSAMAVNAPTVASAAVINGEFDARVLAGAHGITGLPPQRAGDPTPLDKVAVTSMIMLRYPDVVTARKVAATAASKAASGVQVELVIWADRDGHRHVADPSQGVKAWAKSDLISWGLFGVVVGALAGAFGGGGAHNIVDNAVVTGVLWAVFGLVAGALYGLWAGRAVSARRLKGLSSLLIPGSSILIAWADGPVSADTLGALAVPGAQRLLLRFNPVDGGAVLEAA
jgi:hypothetical protein